MKTSSALTTILTLLAATGLVAQGFLDQRIRRIENGLLPAVVVKGRPQQTSRLSDRMTELKIPGVSIAVFRDGRIEWARGWGMADAENRRKVGPETRFQAASISKPVATAAALALVSRERLSLDEDVNGYLHSWNCR